MPAYLARNGISFPDGRRVEPGEVFTQAPDDINWLVQVGEAMRLCDGDGGWNCECEWCRYAALDDADRMFFEIHGYQLPKPPEIVHPDQLKRASAQRPRRRRPQ